MSQLKVGQKIPFTISDPKDVNENPAEAPVLQLGTSDSTVAVVTDVAEDTLSGFVQAVAVGSAVLVDGPEDGEVVLFGGGVDVVAGDAVSATVTFGEPV